MASVKDMRRENLVVPYVSPPVKKNDNDIAATLSSTTPMVAMFTRNRLIGWTSLVFSLQNWMAESKDQKQSSSSPAYLSVLMSLMSVVVTYAPLFLPPVQTTPKGSST